MTPREITVAFDEATTRNAFDAFWEAMKGQREGVVLNAEVAWSIYKLGYRQALHDVARLAGVPEASQ